MYTEWSDDEKRFIEDNYFNMRKKILLDKLPLRNWHSIGIFASRSGIKRSKQFQREAVKNLKDIWSYDEVEVLKKNFFNSNKEELLSLLCKRTWSAIKNKACEFYLKRNRSKVQSIAMKKRYKNLSFQQKLHKSLNKKPNMLEKYFYNVITNIVSNLIYVGDLSFFVGRKNPDFVIEGTNKCIDLFGDYWHKGEDPQKRIKYFEKRGYDLIVIWEHEWNKEKDSVIENILKWVK